MGHDEKHNEHGGDCCMGMWHHGGAKGFKKEFKMAFLNKKEKVLEAKLEFVRELKKLVEKMGSEEK